MSKRLQVRMTIKDTRAIVCKNKLAQLEFGNKISKVFLVDVYTISRDFSDAEYEKIGGLLTNTVSQTCLINEPMHPKDFDWAIEIGFLPGVTDNVSHTAKESIEDLFNIKFKETENVYTSKIYFIKGDLNQKNVNAVSLTLANPLIERIHIKSKDDFIKDNGMDLVLPVVRLEQEPTIETVDLNVSDESLSALGQKGICGKDGNPKGPLSLSLEDLKVIQNHFKTLGRNPTDVELEMLAQTWSEHCKHTIFSASLDDVTQGIYKRYIKGATNKIRQEKAEKDFCVSVFKDNSGGIVFDDDWVITDKVETHNSPSALDPYGGAITGIVGVNRDTIGFGKGAKPIINKYGYCFGEPDDQKALYRGKDKTGEMLSPKRIIEGVIEGVQDGGNQSGIPTHQGFCYFDKRYKGKPLVFVGTVGLMPKKINEQNGWEKRARPGDAIVMTGGRVGKDGIHGATFSSEALTQGSPVSAVQIGDPITQKKMSDAIIKEARDLGLYNSITDNGAGGLSSSIGEMARESGGCKIYLDKVPLKYPGLSPWEIWVSESQERMSLAVPQNNVSEFISLMNKRGVEATVIGEFTETGKCQVFYNSEKAVDLDLEFLHEGLPKKVLMSHYQRPKHVQPDFPAPIEQTKSLMSMMGRFNICDHGFIARQYDHEVQASSVIKPLQGKGEVFGPASVSRPVLSSKKGVILSQGLCPRYSDIDTYHMAACAIDMAVKNIIAAGGSLEHLALLDNFCWCDALNAERLGQLKEAARACYDFAIVYKTPFISGKDSMFNDFSGFDENGKALKISIPPTLLVSSIGVMDDVTKAISIDAKMPGDLVYVLGVTKNELAGSEYFSLVNDASGSSWVGNDVPIVNVDQAIKTYQALSAAINERIVASCLGVGLGGLGVALAKVAVAGQLGLNIDLSKLIISDDVVRNDYALFSESMSRFVVTIDSRKCQAFEKIMKGLPFACVGSVLREDHFEIMGINADRIVKTSVSQLTKAYKATFDRW